MLTGYFPDQETFGISDWSSLFFNSVSLPDIYYVVRGSSHRSYRLESN